MAIIKVTLSTQKQLQILQDNATCDGCDHHTENSFHLFFECPEFADHRTNLMSFINIKQISVPLILNLLLYDEKCFSFKDNEKVFEIVQDHILETNKRFF
jgi:hypothetical protein